eukprot:6884656-Pyramimonas_sp.AAC.1
MAGMMYARFGMPMDLAKAPRLTHRWSTGHSRWLISARRPSPRRCMIQAMQDQYLCENVKS